MTFDAELKRVFDAAVAELAAISKADLDRAHQDGHTKGRVQGLEDGREQGRAEGRSEAEQESRSAIEAAVAAVRAEASADLAAVERLLDAVRAIDRARSLGETLDTLVACAAREVPRAGLVLTRGDRLQGWRFIGFDGLQERGAIDVPLADGGVIAEAVRTGAAASGQTGSEAGAPRFVRLEPGRESFAVPVALAGEVVGVLYADHGPEADASAKAANRQTWPETLEVLTRHASRSLEALTALKAARTLAEGAAQRNTTRRVRSAASSKASSDDEDGATAARRFAKLLVSEIKLYHEAEVTAGRRERDLAARLGGEIARARVLYEQRVPAAVRDRSTYFQDELVRTLANGDASLLRLT